jgi:hypothetical protein
MAFTFLPRDEFSNGLDQAFSLAQPVMTLEHGRNGKVQSWVALV